MVMAAGGGTEIAVAVGSAVAAAATAPSVETVMWPPVIFSGFTGSAVSGSSSGVSSEHGNLGSQAARRAADFWVMTTVTVTTAATTPVTVTSGECLPQENTSGLW